MLNKYYAGSQKTEDLTFNKFDNDFFAGKDDNYHLSVCKEILSELCCNLDKGKKIQHLSLFLLLSLVKINKGILDITLTLKDIQSQLFENRRKKKLLTVKEVAEYLGCSPKTIRNWVLANDIPTVRPQPGMVRFDIEATDQWLSERRSFV